jgi:hypothetical protein
MAWGRRPEYRRSFSTFLYGGGLRPTATLGGPALGGVRWYGLLVADEDRASELIRKMNAELLGDSDFQTTQQNLARVWEWYNEARAHSSGVQVSAIGEDRWRASHPEPPRVLLRRHDLPHHLDIGPGREQRSQPTAQGFRTRAVGHVQDLEPHHTCWPSPAKLRAPSRSRKSRNATIRPRASVSTT